MTRTVYSRCFILWGKHNLQIIEYFKVSAGRLKNAFSMLMCDFCFSCFCFMLLGRSCKILPPNLNELDVLEKKRFAKLASSSNVLPQNAKKLKLCLLAQTARKKLFSLFNFYHLIFFAFSCVRKCVLLEIQEPDESILVNIYKTLFFVNPFNSQITIKNIVWANKRKSY